MDWASVTSFDHIWNSPSIPMWLTLAAAGFFGIVLLITLVRAEHSVANVALTVITLLAIGVAIATTLGGYGPAARSAASETRAPPPTLASLPALSCIDDLAGDMVQQGCEKVLFGSAESTAAAVAYMASMISRLTALGDAATAQATMSSDMKAVRRAVERDRYGLAAQVLIVREGCTPTQCATYRSLTDNHQLITNMDEHLYDGLVARYSPLWNAPQAVGSVPGSSPMAMLPPSLPTGRPTNAEFPSSANTPPVSIMTPEPGTGAKAAPATAAAPASKEAKEPPAPKKQATAKRPPPPPPPPPAAPVGGPTLLSPGTQGPASSND